MSILTETLATLTIAEGDTVSPALGTILTRGQMRTALGFLDNLTIMSPVGLDEDIQVQVSPVRNPTESDWVVTETIEVAAEPGNEITDEETDAITDESTEPIYTEGLGSGGTAQLDDLSFKDIRLMSTTAVAADRDFVLLAKLNIPSGV